MATCSCGLCRGDVLTTHLEHNGRELSCCYNQ
nr:MAG TPA: envelope glycoprotein [Caudoviricetes sp.]